MSTRETVVGYLRSPKAVALAASTVLSVVAAAATLTVVASQLAFLGVIVFGVSVPTTLENYGLLPDDYGRVVLAVAAASLAHWVVFLAAFVVVAGATGELAAAAAAFVVTVVASAVVGRSLGA